MMVTLEEWLAWPHQRLAAFVREKGLSVKLGLDGSSRHYLLRHPALEGRVSDISEYIREGTDILFGLLDRLFGCGFETVLVLNVWPADLTRRLDHAELMADASEIALLSERALRYYADWDVQAHLYGNYDVSDGLVAVRPQLLALDERLALLTHGSRRLLWGYCAGDGLDELIVRSVRFALQTGRPPTEVELRQACFPHGPHTLDVYIGGGWLRAGHADIPPVLNRGTTDLYWLSHLTSDLTESQLRYILYDRIFRRYALSPSDDVFYDRHSLDLLKTYYDTQTDRVIGLGELIGPGLWHVAG